MMPTTPNENIVMETVVGPEDKRQLSRRHMKLFSAAAIAAALSLSNPVPSQALHTPITNQEDFQSGIFPYDENYIRIAYATIKYYYDLGQTETALSCNGVLWLAAMIYQHGEAIDQIYDNLMVNVRPRFINMPLEYRKRILQAVFTTSFRYSMVYSGLFGVREGIPVSSEAWPSAVQRYPRARQLLEQVNREFPTGRVP